MNARLRQGLTFRVGTSTGRSVDDDCAMSTKIDSPDPRNCRDVDLFQTTLRGLGSWEALGWRKSHLATHLPQVIRAKFHHFWGFTGVDLPSTIEASSSGGRPR